MSKSVVLDVDIKASIDKVWSALTDSATLSKWMMFKTNDFKPEVGHTFQFRDAPGYDGVIDCEVKEVDEPTSLVYTWSTLGQDKQPHSTVVSFTLSDGGSGMTSVRVEQSGFSDDADQEFAGAKYAWTFMLDELQKVV